MTDSKALRSKIINECWKYTTTPAHRSPAFHKWLEQTILEDRQSLIQELLNELEQYDNYFDCIEAINKFKKTIK